MNKIKEKADIGHVKLFCIANYENKIIKLFEKKLVLKKILYYIQLILKIVMKLFQVSVQQSFINIT